MWGAVGWAVMRAERPKGRTEGAVVWEVRWAEGAKRAVMRWAKWAMGTLVGVSRETARAAWETAMVGNFAGRTAVARVAAVRRAMVPVAMKAAVMVVAATAVVTGALAVLHVVPVTPLMAALASVVMPSLAGKHHIVDDPGLLVAMTTFAPAPRVMRRVAVARRVVGAIALVVISVSILHRLFNYCRSRRRSEVKCFLQLAQRLDLSVDIHGARDLRCPCWPPYGLMEAAR